MSLNTHPNPLNTNGLNMPIDFDVSTYELINLRVSKHITDSHWKHFAGGWNGIAVRYLSCCESSDAYTSQFKEPNSLNQRYIQERELFSFFVTGLSSLECYFYSLYALGAIINPHNFSMSAKDLKKVDLSVVERLLGKHFLSNLSQQLTLLSKDADYLDWSQIRNILIHRVTPSRMLYLTNNADYVRSDEWKLDDHDYDNIILDDQLTVTRLSWLTNTINSLLIETQSFLGSHGL